MDAKSSTESAQADTGLVVDSFNERFQLLLRDFRRATRFRQKLSREMRSVLLDNVVNSPPWNSLRCEMVDGVFRKRMSAMDMVCYNRFCELLAFTSVHVQN